MNANKIFKYSVILALTVAIIYILTLIFISLFIIQKKSNINIMPIKIETVYELERQSRPLYKAVKLRNLFRKYPKKVSGLTFGYICPGAMKTVEFLNATLKVKGATHQSQVKRIRLLTDFQFFVEIYQIYREYLDESTKLEMMKIIKNNGCKISKAITEEITRLFGELPKKVRVNLPDDFYHIRHNTLVCSKSKTLAKERIELLKSIYGTAEGFSNAYSGCHGKRDGVSGCRNCCQANYSSEYPSCVSSCMNF
jgi:hypothetical protein